MDLPNLMFEGCDCVGKTTLISLIKENYPQYEIIKLSAPKNKEEAEKEYLWLSLKILTQKSLILDRGFLGECVYAPIFRNYYPGYMGKLESYVRNNITLILLTAKTEVIKKRFDGEFIKVNQINKIKKMYEEEFETSIYSNKIKIDTTKEDPQKIFKYLKNKIIDKKWTN